jgi:hypothetical protein
MTRIVERMHNRAPLAILPIFEIGSTGVVYAQAQDYS